MKKTAKKVGAKPAASPRPRPQPAWLKVVGGGVKVVAIGVGLVGTILCLAAMIGLATSNGWVRYGVGILVALVVPAVLTDRLLPKDEPESAGGLLSDVFALTWLGLPVLYVVLLAPMTDRSLRQEGDRLTEAGAGSLASVAYLLAGVEATAVEVPPEALPSASGSSSGAAPKVPPKATPSASASSRPSAPPPDAGAQDSDASTGDRTPAELFKDWSPAVVAITRLVGDQVEGGGTGFAIDDRGTIVTNHHVISAAKGIRIKFINGSIYDEVELLDENAAADLALLRVQLDKPKEGDEPEFKPAVLGNSDEVIVGERAIAIGNPLGLEHTLTDGLVSSRRKYDGKNWIQISVPVSPGNSGGPLFNMRGEVIGITTAQIGGMFGRAQNLNLAVPVDELKRLIKDDYPGRRKFGSSGGPNTW